MQLIDTSVWVDHLREGVDELADLLNQSLVLTHPIVIGELACGNLKNRSELLKLLGDLPQATVANDQEVLGFIEANQLGGMGIGYIDAHLLCATRLTPGASLLTYDKRLRDIEIRLRLAS